MPAAPPGLSPGGLPGDGVVFLHRHGNAPPARVLARCVLPRHTSGSLRILGPAPASHPRTAPLSGPPLPPRLPRSSLASAGPSHLPAPVALNNTAHMPADAHGSPAHSSCSLPQRASLFAPGRPALDQSSEYTRDHRPVPPTPPPAPAAAPKDRASPSWP